MSGLVVTKKSQFFSDRRSRIPSRGCRLIRFVFAPGTNEFIRYVILADGDLEKLAGMIPVQVGADDVYVIFDQRGEKAVVADAHHFIRL